MSSWFGLARFEDDRGQIVRGLRQGDCQFLTLLAEVHNPLLNGGDAAILYCFFFLYLACAGGGAWSLDRLIWKKG